MERYRACVASLRGEMQAQCQRMAAEARALRADLLAKGAALVAAGGQQLQRDEPGERTQAFLDKVLCTELPPVSMGLFVSLSIASAPSAEFCEGKFFF